MKPAPEKPAFPESAMEAALKFWAAENRGKHYKMRLIGNSMFPSMKDGDSLHIDMHPDRLCCGDVLIYRNYGKFIAHRLIRVRYNGEQRQYILRGDALPYTDPPISRERVLGRVVGIENRAGFVDYTALHRRIRNVYRARMPGMQRLDRAARRYGKQILLKSQIIRILNEHRKTLTQSGNTFGRNRR